MVDVGGESTRPGAAPVGRRRGAAAAWCRWSRRCGGRGAGPISVDTTKAEVARAALDAGADIVNDVSGFRFDPAMAALVAERGVPAVLMHLRGGLRATMHRAPAYRDVMGEVVGELGAALARAERGRRAARADCSSTPASASRRTPRTASRCCAGSPELEALDRPVLVGPSRKSFIGKVLGPARRRAAAAAPRPRSRPASCAGAHVVRVHDVREMVQVVRVCDAIRGGAAGRAA